MFIVDKKRKLYSWFPVDLKEIIKQVREELDEHLCAINENTNEIQANYEYLAKLEAKIEKLSERIERIQLFLEEKLGLQRSEVKEFTIEPLTNKEKEVFLTLYTLEETKGLVTYTDIARKTGLPEEFVCSYITRMIEKGVPIVKRYVRDKPYLKLDSRFKELQAKKNILKIEQRTIPHILGKV